MEVLACDDIDEDGLALVRDAGWTVKISEPIKPITVDRAVHAVQPVALRGVPGVLMLEAR